MADAEKQEDGEKKEKSGKGGFIGIAILAIVSIASSFGLNYFLSAPSPAPVAEAACEAEPEVELIKAEVPDLKDQTYVEMPEILITVGSAPADRYLKMRLSIATNKGDEKNIEDAQKVLIDAFLNYLRSIELTDFEDPAFYSHMREQLAWRSELILGASASHGVLITEFLLR